FPFDCIVASPTSYLDPPNLSADVHKKRMLRMLSRPFENRYNGSIDEQEMNRQIEQAVGNLDYHWGWEGIHNYQVRLAWHYPRSELYSFHDFPQASHKVTISEETWAIAMVTPRLRDKWIPHSEIVIEGIQWNEQTAQRTHFM